MIRDMERDQLARQLHNIDSEIEDLEHERLTIEDRLEQLYIEQCELIQDLMMLREEDEV